MENIIDSYINERIQRHAALKRQACQLLEWDDDTYCNYKYQIGVAYLHWLLPCDETLRKEFECSKFFWNWFKNQWAAYEGHFINGLQEEKYQNNLPAIRRFYKMIFDPQAMVHDFTPDEVVMDCIKKEKEVQA